MTTTPTPVIVRGVLGRMGQAVLEAVAAAPDCRLVAALEHPDHSGLGTTVGEGIAVATTLSPEVRGAVLIDFSVPDGTDPLTELVAEYEVALVVGTTALPPQAEAALRSAAERVPVVWAPNMSPGVNLLYELVGRVSAALPAYDVEIVEMHHRGKVDAPSGTARRLAKVIAEAREGAAMATGRSGPRRIGEIGVHAVRGGDVPGEHTICFAGDGERLELVHRATSRRAFAEGALAAARFVATHPPGLYDMRDVLGLV